MTKVKPQPQEEKELQNKLIDQACLLETQKLSDLLKTRLESEMFLIIANQEIRTDILELKKKFIRVRVGAAFSYLLAVTAFSIALVSIFIKINR